MFTQDELNRLYRYSMTLAKHEQNAYDLLQSALEKCLRKPPEHADKKMPYIRTIIRRNWIDQFRANQHVVLEPLDQLDTHHIDIDVQTLESVVITQQHFQQIWETIDVADQEILFLWAIEGYSTAEIATLINTPKGTLLSRIHRLRQKLIQSQEGAVL